MYHPQPPVDPIMQSETPAELYDRCCCLIIALIRCNKTSAWRTELLPEYPCWFMVGLTTQVGEITFHLPAFLLYKVEDITVVPPNLGAYPSRMSTLATLTKWINLL